MSLSVSTTGSKKIKSSHQPQSEQKALVRCKTWFTVCSESFRKSYMHLTKFRSKQRRFTSHAKKRGSKASITYLSSNTCGLFDTVCNGNRWITWLYLIGVIKRHLWKHSRSHLSPCKPCLKTADWKKKSADITLQDAACGCNWVHQRVLQCFWSKLCILMEPTESSAHGMNADCASYEICDIAMEICTSSATLLHWVSHWRDCFHGWMSPLFHKLHQALRLRRREKHGERRWSHSPPSWKASFGERKVVQSAEDSSSRSSSFWTASASVSCNTPGQLEKQPLGFLYTIFSTRNKNQSIGFVLVASSRAKRHPQSLVANSFCPAFS